MIQLKNISKSWKKEGKEFIALNNISLSVNKGDFVSIIGPSGCGKTTLLKIVAGLIRSTKGTVEISGLPGRPEKNRTSMVFQNPVLLEWRTVAENVNLPNEMQREVQRSIAVKKDAAQRVADVINLVGLEEFNNSYPNELSGGMQQRVSIARALVANPEVLLMDEPFGALDEINRNNLNLKLIEIKNKLQPTVLFVTHSISEAVFLSDYVVVLSDRPAIVKAVIKVALPERNLEIKESKEFQEYVKCIREKISMQ